MNQLPAALLLFNFISLLAGHTTEYDGRTTDIRRTMYSPSSDGLCINDGRSTAGGRPMDLGQVVRWTTTVVQRDYNGSPSDYDGSLSDYDGSPSDYDRTVVRRTMTVVQRTTMVVRQTTTVVRRTIRL